MPDQRRSRNIQAVQTALDVIGLLRRRDAAGVTEIADELDRSKGTIHSHLATLRENEYVVKDDGAYRLSLRYLELGEEVRDRIPFYDIVRDELDDLATESGEIAQFATEEHGKAVYIYKSAGANAVRTASSVGRRELMHCISLGKAMLAHFPADRVDEIISRHGLPEYTDRTVSTREELFDELATIRERGYAFDREEKIEGLQCVAAPVMVQDQVLGAVSVSGPSSRMEGDFYHDELPHMVTRSANVIEINTKFS